LTQGHYCKFLILLLLAVFVSLTLAKV